MDIAELLRELTDPDDKKAYKKTKEIAAASEFAPDYYPYLEDFAALLQDPKSYIRTRAFILCCSQARWDREGKLKRLLPDLMALFHDSKPTVVRQCLNAAKEILVFLPELGELVEEEVKKVDPAAYRASMAPLIQKDIRELLELRKEAEKVGE